MSNGPTPWVDIRSLLYPLSLDELAALRREVDRVADAFDLAKVTVLDVCYALAAGGFDAPGVVIVTRPVVDFAVEHDVPPGEVADLVVRLLTAFDADPSWAGAYLGHADNVVESSPLDGEGVLTAVVRTAPDANAAGADFAETLTVVVLASAFDDTPRAVSTTARKMFRSRARIEVEV